MVDELPPEQVQTPEEVPEEEKGTSWEDISNEARHVFHTLHLVKLREEATAIARRNDVFEKCSTGISRALLAEPTIRGTGNFEETKKQVNAFARSYVQLRTDALFRAGTDVKYVAGIIAQLQQRYSKLPPVSADLLVKLENEHAQQNKKDYEQSIRAFNGREEAFREVQLSERSRYLTEEYGRQLEAAGVSKKQYSREISAFEPVIYLELKKATTKTRNPQDPPLETRVDQLMQNLEKRLKRKSAALLTMTQWYQEQNVLRDHLKNEPIFLSHEHIMDHVAAPQRKTNYFAPVDWLMNRTANRAAGIAVRRAGQAVAGRAVQSGATAAGGAAATAVGWPVILGIIAAIVIIIIIIFIVVINQASNVAQPYPAMAPTNETVTNEQPAISPDGTTSVAPLPSGAITKGYGEPGQTWETLIPPHTSQTPLPVQGYFTWFGSPGLMDTVVANRIKFKQITPCPECIGNLSLMRCGDLDRRVWIKRANGTVLGPFRVADCAAQKDVATIVNKKIGNERWIADLSWETAHNTFGGKSETVVIYDRKPE